MNYLVKIHFPRFDEAYGMEMWMETQEGYEGAKELVTRFGLDIQNETSFHSFKKALG